MAASLRCVLAIIRSTRPRITSGDGAAALDWAPAGGTRPAAASAAIRKSFRGSRDARRAGTSLGDVMQMGFYPAERGCRRAGRCFGRKRKAGGETECDSPPERRLRFLGGLRLPLLFLALGGPRRDDVVGARV